MTTHYVFASKTATVGKSPCQIAATKVQELKALSAPNWDGSGADPISERAIEVAEKFLLARADYVGAPEFAPGADGTIGFDWEVGGNVLCVDFSDSDELHFFYELDNGKKREDRMKADDRMLQHRLRVAFAHMYQATPRQTSFSYDAPRRESERWIADGSASFGSAPIAAW